LSTFSLSIACVTCGRSLRITDPTLVGTIAVCPACGSMVQIEGPLASDNKNAANRSPPSLAIGNAIVDSGAVTEESILAEGVLSGAPPPSGFSGTVPSPRSSSDDPVTNPPAVGWQSEQSQRTRKIGLFIATITLTLVTVSAVVYAILSRRDEQASSVDDLVTDPSTPVVIKTPDSQSNPPAAPESNPTLSPDIESETSPTSPPKTTLEPITTESSTQTSSVATDSASSDEPEIDSGLPSLMPTPVINTSADQPLPAKSDLATRTDPATQADPTSQMTELPEGLMPFVPFVLNEDPPVKPSLPALPSLEDVVLKDAADEDEPLEPATNRVIKPESDLAIALKIKTSGKSVSYWLFLIGSITDLPIELDLVSFDVAGIDVQKKFAPDDKTKKASELLGEVAASIQGQIRYEPAFGVVTPDRAVLDAAIQNIIDRSDLPNATQPLQSFLRIEAEDDRLFDDADDNTVAATVNQRLLAALTCESFRYMRKVKPKMESQRFARWAQPLSDANEGWTQLNDAAIADQPDTPITLARFFQIIGESSKSSVLVNWIDFTKRGTGPATRVLPDVLRDPPQAIARTLASKNATVRRIDDQFLWVGNEATYDRLPILSWSEPLGEYRAEFEDRLQVITSRLPVTESRYTYDPVSDRALIMVPRFIHRQITDLLKLPPDSRRPLANE
jgi:hypothetical protein